MFIHTISICKQLKAIVNPTLPTYFLRILTTES